LLVLLLDTAIAGGLFHTHHVAKWFPFLLVRGGRCYSISAATFFLISSGLLGFLLRSRLRYLLFFLAYTLECMGLGGLRQPFILFSTVLDFRSVENSDICLKNACLNPLLGIGNYGHKHDAQY
jgi:hypothetical protein